MRWSRHIALGAGPLLILWAYPYDASACGGCFVGENENSQVSGHRMALSISRGNTSLYDQIEYAGDPSSFAWVLPIHGKADVGLSSDALFATLDGMTQVTVLPPPLACRRVAAAYDAAPTAARGGSEHAADDSVTVLVQEVVGPYETVQLSSEDPAALQSWLTGHGYAIPPEIAPILAHYVEQKFDFLALRLVPGTDVHAMRPVRVTTEGVSPLLPLRMVAAGTGATTAVKLWVLGEGRYEPARFPTFTITADQLEWDWNTGSSNYKTLRAKGFAASGGRAWLVEAAEPFPWLTLQSSVVGLAQTDPAGSGYADESGAGAVAAAGADLDMLRGGTDPSSLWITRLYAELSRDALDDDLEVGAVGLKSVERSFQTTRSTGTPPCGTATTDPTQVIGDRVSRGGCDSDTPGADTAATDPSPSTQEPGRKLEASGGGGCATTRDPANGIAVGALGLALALVARRRTRRAR